MNDWMSEGWWWVSDEDERVWDGEWWWWWWWVGDSEWVMNDDDEWVSDDGIRNFSRSYKYISLAGDFNARTAELKGFSVFTENDFPNGDEYLLENYISCVSDSNLPLNRKHMDKGKTNTLENY